MRYWFWMAAVFLINGQAVPAMADGNMDFGKCLVDYLRGDQDAALALCTRALQSGDLSADQTINALNDRAIIYIGKGEYDLARQDTDQAIRLKPDDAHAYNNRGMTHSAKGEFDKAIQDFEQAIRLKPDDESAYMGRANALANQGEYDRAIQSFDQALQVNPDSTYAALWRAQLLFELARFSDAADALKALVSVNPELSEGALWLTLAQWRAGLRTDDALKAHAQGRDLKEWPGPVIRLYLGQISRDAVQAAALNSDPRVARRQSCQTAFYLGELDLASGRVEAAKPEFQQAIDGCMKGYAFARMAKAELGRM